MKKNCSSDVLSDYRAIRRKLILRMKLAVILICIIGLTGSYASVYSQQTKLDLNVKKMTVKDVLKLIEDQSEFSFMYNASKLDVYREIDLNVEETTVEDVLKKIFTGEGVSYKVIDRNIIISTDSDVSESKPVEQPRSISGKVRDSFGGPLPGVSVVIKGTSNGTITDAEGNYTLSKVPADGTLLFSFVGMKAQEVAVGSKSTINVTLVEETIGIEEVVAVGYGTVKKMDVSGSIVSANSNAIKEVPSVSATAALQGRLPGIDMSQTSTRPGAAMQVRIRGERSINADNNPLIVVDGIPFTGGSLNDISPSDIKSIDILKDASSTAIYGSRGANGVILVTTFRANNNSEPTIVYNGYVGTKAVAKKYEMYNAEEFQALRHATLNTQYKDTYTTLEQASIAAGTSTDWQDLMYKNATVTNHDFSISSGGKKGAYSFGGGYYNESTVLPGQQYTRYSLRTTIDQEIGKYLKAGLSTQNSYGITDGESASLMNNILTLSPLMPPYNDDGSVRNIPTEGSVDTYYNPLLLKNSDLWQERRKRFASFNSLYGEIKFTDFLKYRLNVGLSYYKESYGNFYGSTTPFQNGGVSSAAVQNSTSLAWTLENLLYFDKVFAEKHRVNVTAMYSAEQSEYDKSQMDANNLAANYLYYYNLGLANGDKTITAANQDYNQRGLLSYMGRVQYGYKDRYLLTATFRADGASVLASGHKWHTYPAFSAGWNINKESFMQNITAISQLKLRLGYGQTSNQAIAPYSTMGQLSQLPYNFGATNLYGALVSNLPNPNLGWEFTENYNAGLDFGFFDGRISGYLDVYFQKTKDLLVAIKLPSTSGVSGSMFQNVGSTENKGIEFSISGQVVKPKEKGDFAWDVDFNIYANRNKLTALNSGVLQDTENGLFVGYPVNVIYDYERLGIIQTNEAPYFGRPAGQIKVRDINNDGKISADYDRKILGAFEPDFAGGFSTRFSYKNFDLSVVGFYKSGGMLVSTIQMPQSYLNVNNGRRNSIKVDYWTPNHTSGTYPQPGNQNTAEVNDYGNTLGFFSASFLKVRTITLGYTFDKELLNKIGCKDARIYFTCQNPFTLFSPYMDAGGLDPEATGVGAQAATTGLKAGSGIQDRQLTIGANTPPTRNFLVGLSLKF